MTTTLGSLDIRFKYLLQTGHSVTFSTNTQAVRQLGEGEALQDISLDISNVIPVDKIFVKIQLYLGTDLIDVSDFSTYDAAIDFFDIRIYLHAQYISVYVNDKWVYTYAFSSVLYQDTPSSSLTYHGTGGGELDNIDRSELSDSREAIYADYESNADSIIGMVIQQRPIEFYPGPRSIGFTYLAHKDDVSAHHLLSYSEAVQDPSQASSDGLVYYADVGISISEATAKEMGLITRLYRLSELDFGAIQATKALQEKSLENRNTPSTIGRFDPRIEKGDVWVIDYYVSGTNRHIQDRIIVQDVNVHLDDGRNSMTISGRRDK